VNKQAEGEILFWFSFFSSRILAYSHLCNQITWPLRSPWASAKWFTQ